MQLRLTLTDSLHAVQALSAVSVFDPAFQIGEVVSTVFFISVEPGGFFHRRLPVDLSADRAEEGTVASDLFSS